MDDFGTGYSSLSYLQSVPIDKIKIDQTFISNLDSNPQSAAIVRAVIGLARGLDLPVIAEGVETSNQLAFLSREACDEVQVISSAARTRSTIMPRSLGDGCRANADAPWPADDRLLSAVCSDSPLFLRHAFSESKNVAWRGTAFDHRRFGSCRSPAKESNMRLFTGFLAAMSLIAVSQIGASPAIAQAQSPSPGVSDKSADVSEQKLDAAAAAIQQVANLRQNYQQQLADAAPSDKERIVGEANNALEKAVKDQGLSVEEYTSILQMAQNDPDLRGKILQRLKPEAK